ncbi:MAG: metal-sensitive transcriptional regulator [Leptolyngbyaceae cyanobacterium CRU_2_3]|nr:metal-sensitive transcriptional regulator [Leptolyngbyaceae cyanobacterium CRU_2_3]
MAASELPNPMLDLLHIDADANLGHEHEHKPDQSNHTHIHSEESLRRLVNRLSRIEGHVRGIKMMVQESRPCPDVLVQLAAVRGGIDRVSRMILDEHLTDCVARAAQEGNIEAEIAALKAALDRFLP